MTHCDGKEITIRRYDVTTKIMSFCDGSNWCPIDGGCDTTPDAFGFTDQTEVALFTLIESNIVLISGINVNASQLSDFPCDIDLLRGCRVSLSTVPVVVAHLDLHVSRIASFGTALGKNEHVES